MASKEVYAFTRHISADICIVSKVTDVTGCKMFSHLLRLAKASLTISYANAMVVCGFSTNTAVLSKDRMLLDETTIQALRLVKKTIHLHSKPTAVPVT